ncbi:MAG TPA: hypothetical protein VGB74_00300 [Actinoplanes sp.]|jgi:hypothetical protein
MSIYNSGPRQGVRRGNATPGLRDGLTDEVTAASGRASTVTHRFGGVRYALTRRAALPADRGPLSEEGESDARQ